MTSIPSATPHRHVEPDDSSLNEFVLPTLFVDGVPCTRFSAGVDATGEYVYETRPIEIPSHVPSLYWREGC